MRKGLFLVLFSFLNAHVCLADIHSDLMTAIQDNDAKSVELLFPNAGFSLAVTGWTPMHEAAYWNSVLAAEKLFELGAEFLTPDGYGWTPIHIARSKKNVEMINFLYAKGAR